MPWAFPAAYIDDYGLATTISDIEHLEQITSTQTISVKLYSNPDNSEYPLQLRLFQHGKTYFIVDHPAVACQS